MSTRQKFSSSPQLLNFIDFRTKLNPWQIHATRTYIYLHLPQISVIHDVGKYTIVPWILWVYDYILLSQRTMKYKFKLFFPTIYDMYSPKSLKVSHWLSQTLKMYLLLKNGGFFQSVMLLFSGVFVYDRFCDPHFKYCWFRNPIPNHLGYIYIYYIKPCKNHGINYLSLPPLKLVGNGLFLEHINRMGVLNDFFFASPPSEVSAPKEGRCQSNQLMAGAQAMWTTISKGVIYIHVSKMFERFFLRTFFFG